MEIQAAGTESKGAPFEIRRVQLDDPRPDEVLVRVLACGICHTDLIIRDQWYRVPLPAVLGHDGAGVVEAVGSAVSQVGAVLRTFRPEAGASIAVFGVGTVGLSAVMAARVAGCSTIIGIDVRAARLELASDLGATHVVDASSVDDPVDAIREATRGVGADYSIDATASPEVLQQAVYCTGPGGA